MNNEIERLEKAQFLELDQKVQAGLNTVREVAALAKEIKDKELWRWGAFVSWNDYCKARFGKTASAFRMLEYRDEARKLLKQTTGEKVDRETLLRPNKSKQEDSKKVIEVIAKVEPPVAPIGPEPPALPESEDPRELRSTLKALTEVMESMSRNRLFATDPKFKEAFILARRAVAFLSVELPGIVEHLDPDNTPKRRGSKSEVLQYVLSLGLPQSDAEWLWDKFLAAGWKNGGKPISDWRAVARTWKTACIFPSLKNYANNTQRGFAGRPGPARTAPDYSKGW